VLGVATNLGRLRTIVGHPAFRAGDLHTGFIDEHLRMPEPPTCPPALAWAAAAVAVHQGNGSGGAARRAGPASDPWGELGAWRLGERG
jgi:3-methylcrotonyl-CoA carboxylase alpha subunit